MSNKQPIGRKHDQGKTLSATVLAGFWRVAGRDEVSVALLTNPNSGLDGETVEALIDVFDEFFDADLTIEQRVRSACHRLTTCGDPKLYLRGAIEVGSYGARKYERDNWLHVEDGINRYYEAVGRHVEDLICGHWYDDDKEGPDGETVEGSHLPNLSHIFWGILAAGELLNRKRDAETFEGEMTADAVLEIDHEAEERAAHAEILSMTHLFVKPDAPKLVLPLEVGREYLLVCDHRSDPYRGSANKISNDEYVVAGWGVDPRTGECLYVKGRVVEGPVSE